jgi:hypothetical protein
MKHLLLAGYALCPMPLWGVAIVVWATWKLIEGRR